MFLVSFIGTDSIARTVLFQDDFSSLVDHWQLQEGWQVVSDDGNAVLQGSQHSFALTGSTFWKNYSLTTRVKLKTAESATHLNYRSQGCERYFIGFNTGEAHLSKTYPCGTHTLLASAPAAHDIDRWYTVKIVGNAGNIKVYVDDLLQIDFTDPNPLLSGEIAFEGFDNSTVSFDDVTVVSDEPLSATPWQKTGGPLGGLGYDVRIHPTDKNIMYVTDNYAGVVRSDNSGQTWAQTNTGITVKGGPTGDTVNIFSLTVDPNNPAIIWGWHQRHGHLVRGFQKYGWRRHLDCKKHRHGPQRRTWHDFPGLYHPKRKFGYCLCPSGDIDNRARPGIQPRQGPGLQDNRWGSKLETDLGGRQPGPLPDH